MKISVCVHLDSDVVDLLRAKAAELRVSQGALLGLGLRLVAAKLPADRLAQWAESARPKAGRPPTRPEEKRPVGRPPGGGDGLTKRERAVLDAFKGLLADGNGTWRFVTAEIARRAGCWPSEALQALYALEARGLVARAADPVDPEGVDRWGRPILWWSLISSMPAHARLREQA